MKSQRTKFFENSKRGFFDQMVVLILLLIIFGAIIYILVKRVLP